MQKKWKTTMKIDYVQLSDPALVTDSDAQEGVRKENSAKLVAGITDLRVDSVSGADEVEEVLVRNFSPGVPGTVERYKDGSKNIWVKNANNPVKVIGVVRMRP